MLIWSSLGGGVGVRLLAAVRTPFFYGETHRARDYSVGFMFPGLADRDPMFLAVVVFSRCASCILRRARSGDYRVLF